MTGAGVFAQHAPEYLDAGLAPFPVNTRAKRPAVRNWQRSTPRASRAWMTKFPEADGLGILMGAASGLTEVDVDAVGPAHVAAAIERFGETPVVIATASGKAKLWYRHDGEQRHIRPIPGFDLDVLGGGFTIAPPSRRDDLGAGYSFVQGDLDDLGRLPKIRANALETLDRASVAIGTRNETLWRWAMTEARHVDDLEALIDAAATLAATMPDPLPLAEIEQVARSAWRYQCKGRNFVGMKRPQISAGDRDLDALIDAPDAFVLLSQFRRYHSYRPRFAISPTRMQEAGQPPWSRQRIERARDTLLERGYLVTVRPPSRGAGQVGVYRLAWGPGQGGRGV